jgi:hypothetical protein
MGNRFTRNRKKKKEEKERIKNVQYGRKTVPSSSSYGTNSRTSRPTNPSGSSKRAVAPYSNRNTGQKEITYKDAKKNPKKNGYKNVVTIDVDVDTPQGAKSYHYEVDENKFVKMTIDYLLSTRGNDASYLIGYKMVYMVDSKRRKIPGVIAIVTLKIPRHANSIYQSEGKHKKKDLYKMINFAKQQGYGRYYNRDSQAHSLPSRKLRRMNMNVDGNGKMVAWEHSTKYCAYQVETLGITILGRLKNVVVASHLYDQNLACAESAFTLEERKTPVVYEVGQMNVSRHERPRSGIGKCLDFFHFFLHPQYAIDYGFYNFLLDENQNAIDLKTITVSKQFDKLRKVSYFKETENPKQFIEDGKRRRDRSTAEFVETRHGYRTRQYVINDNRNRRAAQEEANRIDADLDSDLRDLEDELNSSSSDSNTTSVSMSNSTSNTTSNSTSESASVQAKISASRYGIKGRPPVREAWPEFPTNNPYKSTKHKKRDDSDTSDMNSESSYEYYYESSDSPKRRVAVAM